MRVYFKGAVVGLVVVLALLLMAHQRFKTQQHKLSTGGARKSYIRQTADSGERMTAVTHRKRPATSHAMRQGASTSATKVQTADERPSSQPSGPGLPSSARGDQQHRRSSRPSMFDSDGASGESVSPAQAARDGVAAVPPPAAASGSPPGAVVVQEPEVSRGATRDATPAAGGSIQHGGSEEEKARVAAASAETAAAKMDIRTVDPLSATEPMVIRQQLQIEQEQEQERLGYQPWRGRPKPPEKLQDPSKAWLTDLEYPSWYTESVKRSSVYGRERDFVGGDPLFDGPCPGAQEAKAKLQAEKTPTFPYIEAGEFIPNSKNPCWYEDPVKKKQMRCLPYFYVAGVAKCGTTDLYKRIRYHPDIMQGELKEYHWWDRLRYGAPMELKFTEDSEKNDRPLPLSVYSRIIMGDEVELLKQELRKNQSVRICGDGSPAYLWDPKQWYTFEGNEGCQEPRVVIGSFIKHAVPQSKIILLFRQPTQRLYSRFLSRRDRSFKGATSKTFHDYVVRGIAMYKDCFRQFSIRHCAYNKTLYDAAEIRIIEGLYSVFMEDWLRIFRREQILVLRNEDYSEDIEGHILKVFSFLGVAAKLDKSQMRTILTHVSTNIGQNYGKVGPMLPETIALLNEFYKPFVLRLHELLGDDRFLWKDIAVT